MEENNNKNSKKNSNAPWRRGIGKWPNCWKGRRWFHQWNWGSTMKNNHWICAFEMANRWEWKWAICRIYTSKNEQYNLNGNVNFKAFVGHHPQSRRRMNGKGRSFAWTRTNVDERVNMRMACGTMTPSSEAPSCPFGHSSRHVGILCGIFLQILILLNCCPSPFSRIFL